MKLSHINCKDTECQTCMEESMDLQRVLVFKTENNKDDHLGEYHKWLGDNGIPNETEWGWFEKEAFDDENINAYIEWFGRKEFS